MPEKDIFSSQAWSDDLNKAIRDYHLFATQPVSQDTKEFIAYHNACKAALAHILLLKKLVFSTSQSELEPDFLTLLEQAQKATQQQGAEDDSFD